MKGEGEEREISGDGEFSLFCVSEFLLNFLGFDQDRRCVESLTFGRLNFHTEAFPLVIPAHIVNSTIKRGNIRLFVKILHSVDTKDRSWCVF